MDDSHVAQEDDEEDESEPELGRLPMPDCEAPEANDQFDISVGIRVGSQDDEPDNFGQDGGRTLPERSSELSRRGEVQRWHAVLQDPMSSGLQPCLDPPDILAGNSSPHETTQEGTVYSRTVSTIIQSTRWSDSSTAAISSTITAFSKYSTSTSHHRRPCGSSQWALKYILFTLPLLHTKSPNPTFNDSSVPLRQDSASAERRRREKLNERFVILRSLVPFVTKMDKASILGDTIEYLKHLCEKIQELEDRTRQMEAKAKQKKLKELPEKRCCPVLSPRNKKKRGITGDGGERKEAAAQVEVSIIESDALVEIQCLHKEGLLINVIQMLRKFMIEVVAVQSSTENGLFAAVLRAKVGESVDGGKATIMEVKREINRIIYS